MMFHSFCMQSAVVLLSQAERRCVNSPNTHQEVNTTVILCKSDSEQMISRMGSRWIYHTGNLSRNGWLALPGIQIGFHGVEDTQIYNCTIP